MGKIGISVAPCPGSFVLENLKSTLAQALGEIFGCGEVFMRTVQDVPAPDLERYDAHTHGYLFLLQCQQSYSRFRFACTFSSKQ